MSTYYYAICTKHEVSSRILGGRSFPNRWWSNDGGELEQFLEIHGDCKPPPLIVSEHDERTLDYAQMPDEEEDA